MTINKTAEGGKLTIALEGRLDTNTAPQLEAELKRSVSGVTELVLDFTGLEYTYLPPGSACCWRRRRS